MHEPYNGNNGNAEGDKASVHGNSEKNGVIRNGKEESFPFPADMDRPGFRRH